MTARIRRAAERGWHVRQPDEAEFTAFVVGSSRRLLHAADLLTGDRCRAEDLVQHAYSRVYVRWTAIRSGNPEAYARRIMLNHYLDWWRRVRPRELPLLDGVEPSPVSAPAGVLAERVRSGIPVTVTVYRGDTAVFHCEAGTCPGL